MKDRKGEPAQGFSFFYVSLGVKILLILKFFIVNVKIH